MATERRTIPDRRGFTVVAERDLEIAAPPVGVLHGNAVVRNLRDNAFDERRAYDIAKRGFDIAVSLVVLLAALPVFAVIALMIKLDTPGPVFFRQARLGKGTNRFMMLKFRSMRINCEEIPAELLQLNESSGPLFKMKADPRITRVGRILRRTSLDELPQLINVLLGTMSIVGPRPPLPREIDGFEVIQRQRLRVKPGLAGLWQVSGRSNIPFDEMVRLDLLYIERRSLFYDLKLILQTIPCVLTGRGAY